MNSFSQGVFVFKNGLQSKPEKKRKSKYAIPQSTFDCDESIRQSNEEFERTWGYIKSKVDEIQANNNDGHLSELCAFVKDNTSADDTSDMTFLRVAALMTGINKPDHHQYFRLLSNTMNKKKIARTVFLPARDCPNVRTAIETLVSCLLNNGRKHNYRDDVDVLAANNNSQTNIGSDDSEVSDNEMEVCEEDDDDEPPVKLRRSQYTMEVLQSWYNTTFSMTADETKPQLAIIMPNSEEFKPNIIKDLVMILSNHCKSLPFVLILGVATSTTALLNTLSFTETTRIKLRVFSGQPPNQILDQIFDDVILTPKCPFQLASNVLDYLKSVFIFYDLTAKNFLKSFHYCLLDQYSRGNAYSVCATTFKQTQKNIKQLKHDDFETIRRLPSFRPYVEAMKDRKEFRNIVDIFENDDFFRKHLMHLVQNIYEFNFKFYGYIRFFWTLVKDLPKTPFGKRLSDIYMYCHVPKKSITTTEEFDKCWQFLSLMSKDEFVALLEKCIKSLGDYEESHADEFDKTIDEQVLKNTQDAFDETARQLDIFIKELKQDRLHIEQNQSTSSATTSNENKSTNQMYNSRTEFYKNLKKQNQANRIEANNTMQKVLDFLRVNVVEKYFPARNHTPPLLELFVYSDYDRVRSNLRGTSRSAIHKALTDPHSYLQCKCCGIDNSGQLLPTMPDNSIAYGLLLESGQQVNIYDWLSAFNAITSDKNAEDQEDEINISPEIQAKFTRSRAELHFMGFTKNSKRKTDHVTRTTW
ncbi:origin recognition complex subunit 3 [Contarinia nasturtii]|uniref:origin recognition complex subunit 3 n=1 Tax=Contarinia nasturtii TaxID=265458 RepID=UPI0012D3B605|nr:origin recognition complex subunit 3 [Contarinia nasturtii]